MTPEEIQRALGEKRQQIGQRIADLPQQESKLRSEVFADPELTALRSTEQDKIRQMYEADKRLADRYANPASEVFLEDPYAREKARAIQFQGSLGEIGTVQNQIAQRRDVLGDALERGMKMFLAGLDALKYEYSGLQDEFTAALQLEEMKQRKLEREQQVAEKKSTETKKTAEEKALAEAMQYLLTQTGSREEAKEDIAAIAARNPAIAGDVFSLLNLFPEKKEEKFGFSMDESAAGVAGLPKTSENIRRFQEYAAKQKEIPEERVLRLSEEEEAKKGPGFLERLFGKSTPSPQGTTGNVTERARLAQQAIDSSTDKRGTYERIISAEPDLIPYVHP